MIGIQITGLNDVQALFKKLGEQELYNSTVESVAEEAHKIALQICPVDTGELRKSIFLSKSRDSFILGATAGHAIINEYGSLTTPIGSVQSPISAKKYGYRPFLRPAAYRAMQKVDYIFGQKFAEAIK